jgi:hypothetical protein
VIPLHRRITVERRKRAVGELGVGFRPGLFVFQTATRADSPSPRNS